MFSTLESFVLSFRSIFTTPGHTVHEVKLENMRRTVETGRSCWHADLRHLETVSSSVPLSVDQAQTLSYRLVTLLRESSRVEGDYELAADSIQSKFEFSSKAKLLEEQKSVSQCRKRVYKWRNGLQDLHTHFVAAAKLLPQPKLMDLMSRAWAIYVAVCNEINGRKVYNSIELFLLTFVSYMLIQSYWVIPFIGFGYAASCNENAYKFYMEYETTSYDEIIRLLQDSMNEVPAMYKRAQIIESNIAWRLKEHTLPPAFLEFITTGCSILREPNMLRRKNGLNEMILRWKELLSPANRPDPRSRNDGDLKMYHLMNDLTDLLWIDGEVTPSQVYFINET